MRKSSPGRRVRRQTGGAGGGAGTVASRGNAAAGMAKLKANAARVRAAELPQWIKPQLTRLVDEPPDGPDWLHEIKLDGLPDARPAGPRGGSTADPHPWRRAGRKS